MNSENKSSERRLFGRVEIELTDLGKARCTMKPWGVEVVFKLASGGTLETLSADSVICNNGQQEVDATNFIAQANAAQMTKSAFPDRACIKLHKSVWKNLSLVQNLFKIVPEDSMHCNGNAVWIVRDKITIDYIAGCTCCTALDELTEFWDEKCK